MITFHFRTVGVTALCLILASTLANADHEQEGKQRDGRHPKSGGIKVSQLIGQPVVNNQEEKLGKVQDIIIDTSSGKASYAIIALNKSVSGTESRVAVPVTELKCSAHDKAVILRATPDELRTSTKNLSGEWTNVRDAEWSQKVDGFYGQSAAAPRTSTSEVSVDTKEGRTFVRDPAPKGGELLITPDDAALADKICENIEVVQVRVQNGVTHIYGTVSSEQARNELETRVRGIQGVHTLESHLRVRTP